MGHTVAQMGHNAATKGTDGTQWQLGRNGHRWDTMGSDGTDVAAAMGTWDTMGSDGTDEAAMGTWDTMGSDGTQWAHHETQRDGTQWAQSRFVHALPPLMIRYR